MLRGGVGVNAAAAEKIEQVEVIVPHLDSDSVKARDFRVYRWVEVARCVLRPILQCSIRHSVVNLGFQRDTVAITLRKHIGLCVVLFMLRIDCERATAFLPDRLSSGPGARIDSSYEGARVPVMSDLWRYDSIRGLVLCPGELRWLMVTVVVKVAGLQESG